MANKEEHPIASVIGGMTGVISGVVQSIPEIAKEQPESPSTPLHNEEIQYEHTDASMRGIFITGVSLLVGIWIISALLYFYFAFLAHRRSAESLPPLRATLQDVAPSQPRLQGSPTLDLQALFRAQHAEQTSYRWLSHEKGIVAIPIDRAMQILAQRGIPAQKAPAGILLSDPRQGTLLTGFEGKVEPEPK